jgi:HlyD family secretion protein
MSDMIFEGNVDETEVGKLHLGMPISLTIGAIEKKTFAAEIEHIAPKGKLISGTIQFGLRAKVVLEKDFFIRSGYSANADIVLQERQNTLSLEEGNLIFKNNEAFADVLVGEQQFERRKLETGLSDGIYIEVLSGLSPTDRVKVQ